MTLDYYQRDGSDFEHVGSVTAEGEIVEGESHSGVQGLAGDLEKDSVSPVDALLLHTGYNSRIVDTRPVEQIPDEQLKRLDGPEQLTHGGSADGEADTSDTAESDETGDSAGETETADKSLSPAEKRAHERLDGLLDTTDGLAKAGNPHRLLASHTDPYPIDAVMLATKQAHDLSWIARMEQEANTNPERRRYIAQSDEVGAILKALIAGSDAYAGL